MTDSEIEQWVLREFQFAKQIQSRELCVSAQQGIVTLDGTVPSRLSKVAATRTALRARGVKRVVNNLRALPSRDLRGTDRVMVKAAGATASVVHRRAVLTDPIARIY